MLFTLGIDKKTKKRLVIAPYKYIGYAALINETKNPNCASVLAIVAGKVRIIIYTTKKISIN